MEQPNLADLVKLDDSALIAWRRQARTDWNAALTWRCRLSTTPPPEK
jgi:hypothetical protein